MADDDKSGKKNLSWEDAMSGAGVLPATTTPSPHAGINQLTGDINAIASSATAAIATGWHTYVEPGLNRFNADMDMVAADGRKRWSDLSSAVTAAVTHPATDGVSTLSKVAHGAAYYARYENAGEALKEGATFAAETAVAAVSVVAEDVQTKIESAQRTIETVSRKLPTFKP